MSEHSYNVLTTGDGRMFRAACSCGWISDAFLTAGMAGAAFDRHVRDVSDV